MTRLARLLRQTNLALVAVSAVAEATMGAAVAGRGFDMQGGAWHARPRP